MPLTVFNSAFNGFCMEWATPIPGNTTVYGGPIRIGSEAARKSLKKQQEVIFEQLMLFDSVNFSINGPNTIVPLLYRAMGDRALEGLLEQDALSFTIWVPEPMMASSDGRVSRCKRLPRSDPPIRRKNLESGSRSRQELEQRSTSSGSTSMLAETGKVYLTVHLPNS